MPENRLSSPWAGVVTGSHCVPFHCSTIGRSEVLEMDLNPAAMASPAGSADADNRNALSRVQEGAVPQSGPQAAACAEAIGIAASTPMQATTRVRPKWRRMMLPSELLREKIRLSTSPHAVVW